LSSALGEGFYSMAEKLAWGYEDIEPNHAEAFKLFRQAADLGFSDALIRVGEFQEYGKGTAREHLPTPIAQRPFLRGLGEGIEDRLE
jgi:TPR repeat protein